jgi:hypothetical protein
MGDQVLVDTMGAVERFGVVPALMAWIVSVFAVVAMTFAQRNERRIAVHMAAAGVGAIALAANLFDYFVTLGHSPELSLEANPLYSGMVAGYGVETAKLYALSGKIMVSILAAQMFAYYLSNIERLYPKRASTLVEFAFGMGSRARNTRERWAALFTLFAFLFAGVQPLYFYIGILNGIQHSARMAVLPSVTTAIIITIVFVYAAFLVLTYGAYRARPRTRSTRRHKLEGAVSVASTPSTRRIASS